MSGNRPRRPASVARLLSERARAEAPSAAVSLDGLFGGLKEAVEALGRAAEAAQRQGGQGGAEGRVVFGYTLRGLDGAAQAFGHVPRGPAAASAAAPVVPEARTPIVDVFEEAAAIVVVAEVPGLDPAALTLAVQDGALVIEGGGAQRYHHRVPLPGPVRAEALSHACRNGILEVRLPRAGGAG
jgi:HSP20 family molecular chaperone IbpA